MLRRARSPLFSISANVIRRLGDSTVECGDERIENPGDGVRGVGCTGETEAGGLEEFAGDSDGADVAVLGKERTEVGEGILTSEGRLLSTRGGRSLKTVAVGGVVVPRLGSATLVCRDNSRLWPCGGETGAEGTSVGAYTLGGESWSGLAKAGTSRTCASPWSSSVCSTNVLFCRGELATGGPLTMGRLGSLSEPLPPSVMGVRARRVASEGSEEPVSIGGILGRGGDSSPDERLTGSSVEGRCDGGALVCSGFKVALGDLGGSTRWVKIFMRRDRTTEVRSLRGSIPSAESRSRNSN
jgi:hypothetical protein